MEHSITFFKSPKEGGHPEDVGTFRIVGGLTNSERNRVAGVNGVAEWDYCRLNSESFTPRYGHYHVPQDDQIDPRNYWIRVDDEGNIVDEDTPTKSVT
jgi:Ser-tRNA(Ala) deacylase AlaX